MCIGSAICLPWSNTWQTQTLNGRSAAMSLPYYDKAIKANTALQSVFLGMKPKRTVVCNQSSHYAKTLKANTALQSVLLGTKPKWTVVCSDICKKTGQLIFIKFTPQL